MKKTVREMFEDIKELEVADYPPLTIAEVVPFKCNKVEESLKAIEVLQDGFSFSSYNPNGDYVVISFTIKENCNRKLINEILFGGSEVLKCQKE